jgi:Protein of unknown function (DUF2851)
MQEVDLYRLWEHYALKRQPLSWQGHTLRILSAGRLNTHQGPDYQAAYFEYNGVQYRGAVEMHLSLDDWYRHQHHLDPAYRDVQLHIIAEVPKKTSEVRHSMLAAGIPGFVFPITQQTLEGSRHSACSSFYQVPQIKNVLQQLALDRLNYKVHVFQKELAPFSVHTLFYYSFFKALGYPFNKNIFEWLARRISIGLIDKYKSTTSNLLALYLGSAGFLDSDYTDPFAQNLKERYKKIYLNLNFSPLSIKRWQFAAVRPANHPEFRLAGWAALVTAHSTAQIFYLFYNLLEQRLPYKNLFTQLKQYMSIRPDGYWQAHYALSKPLANKHNNVYFGQDRIKEIITNLIIPLSMAYSHKNKNHGFMAYLEEFYLSIPGSCNYASIFRRKPWLMAYKKEWPVFNLGQAFLELEQGYCYVEKCAVCPLGRMPQTIC